MKFTCTINLDNAAFEGDTGELLRVLKEVAAQANDAHQEYLASVEDADEPLLCESVIGAGRVFDSNGNRVGSWHILVD